MAVPWAPKSRRGALETKRWTERGEERDPQRPWSRGCGGGVAGNRVGEESY